MTTGMSTGMGTTPGGPGAESMTPEDMRTRELRHDIEATRADMGRTLDQLGDRVSPRRVMERRTERVRTTWTRVRESVMGNAHMAGDRTSGALGSAADTVQHAPEAVTQQVRGNPFAAGIVAYGIGMLAGSLWPATQAERDAARRLAPAAQPVVEQAKQAGQEVAAGLKESAQDEAQDLGQTAAESARRVGDQVGTAAHEVRDASGSQS